MYRKKENRISDKRAAKTCFLLVEPKGFENSGEVAMQMARCRGVKEVHLTSGNYGFVVSANTGTRKNLNRISSAVKKAAGSKSVKVAVSHFVYR